MNTYAHSTVVAQGAAKLPATLRRAPLRGAERNRDP